MSRGYAMAVWRVLVLLALTLATLGFSLTSLCGATFTAIGLASLWMGTAESVFGSVPTIALLSLLVGGAAAWGCGYLLIRLLNQDPK